MVRTTRMRLACRLPSDGMMRRPRADRGRKRVIGDEIVTWCNRGRRHVIRQLLDRPQRLAGLAQGKATAARRPIGRLCPAQLAALIERYVGTKRRSRPGQTKRQESDDRIALEVARS